MTERINPKWLQPMPAWYADFTEVVVDEAAPLPNINPEGERKCAICGDGFFPAKPQAGHRRVCYDPICEAARKRRNRLISARRVAERKRLQS